MDDQGLPATAEQLVALLDKTYPELSADPSWSDREVWMRAGERRLVRWLLRLRDEAADNILETTNVL